MSADEKGRCEKHDTKTVSELLGAGYTEADMLACTCCLRDEIERLRKALQEIVEATPPNEHKVWPHHHFYLVKARKALAEPDTTIIVEGNPGREPAEPFKSELQKAGYLSEPNRERGEDQ